MEDWRPNHFFGALLLVAAACGSAPGVAKLAPGAGASVGSEVSDEASVVTLRSDEAVQSFATKQGAKIEVTIVPVKVLASGEAAHLLSLRGTTSELEHAPMLVNRVLDGNGKFAYHSIILHGGRYTPFTTNIPRRKSFLRLPEGLEHDLHPSKPVIQPDAIVEAHNTAAANGVLAEVEEFGREYWLTLHTRMLQRGLKDAESKCGGKLDVSVDFSNASNEQIVKTSNQCMSVTDSLARLCEDAPRLKARILGGGPYVCIPEYVGTKSRKHATEKGLQLSTGSYGYTKRKVWDIFREHFGYTVAAFQFGDGVFILDPGTAHSDMGAKTALYYGTKTKLWKIGTGNSGSSDGEVYYLLGAAPSGEVAMISETGTGWTFGCLENSSKTKPVSSQPLTKIPHAETEKILATAKFETERWKREPYALARDSLGTYYYVDHYRREFGGKSYRVFIGRRGQMKPAKLKNVVDDAKGAVFRTTNGDLRLLFGPEESEQALWIRGKRHEELTRIPTKDSRDLIYDELGVYVGVDFGHPCPAQ